MKDEALEKWYDENAARYGLGSFKACKWVWNEAIRQTRADESKGIDTETLMRKVDAALEIYYKYKGENKPQIPLDVIFNIFAPYLTTQPQVNRELVERVARAIAISIYHSEGLETMNYTGELNYADREWTHYEKQAKAAIAALQPPTDNMKGGE